MSTTASDAVSSTATGAATTEQKYFDLHITGVGYLNRPREVLDNEGVALYCRRNTLKQG